MPLLIRTPEQIFRSERKDLHVLHSTEDVPCNGPGMLMIQQWIRDTFPACNMEFLAPSEYSNGFFDGMGSQIRVDFFPEDLKKFDDHWNGSLDPVTRCFQLYLHPFQEWYDQYGCFIPTCERPDGFGPIVWWHTPLGFIHHQLIEEEQTNRPFAMHPAHAEDIWFHVPVLWPELAVYDPQSLAHGKIYTASDGVSQRVIWTGPIRSKLRGATPTPGQIRNWFNLPADTSVSRTISRFQLRGW